MMSQIIRREEGGVEFFTLQETGESGMSKSGLARFCGVAQSTISEMLTNLAIGNRVPECLKPFAGIDFLLSGDIDYKGADIIKDDLCAAIIEYYAFESTKHQNSEVAKFAYRKFAKLGIRSFIHTMTGYQGLTATVKSINEKPDINTSLYLLNSLLDPLTNAGVDMRLIQSAKISALAVQHPEYQQMLAATKENLVLMSPDDDRRYSPTVLGEMYAEKHGRPLPVSPRTINKALQEAGYQLAEYRHNSKGKQVLQWNLTAEGEEFGKIFLEAAQGCNKTLSVIRWLPAVLDAIAIAQ